MFNSDKAPGEEESSRTDPTYSIKQPAKEGYFFRNITNNTEVIMFLQWVTLNSVFKCRVSEKCHV